MKVIAFTGFGEAPSITEIETPTPAPGEVRVRVHSASVNGFDLAVANGYLQLAMEHRFPVVLGKDFAGVVDAVGEDAEGFAVGDRVFGVVTKEFLGDGSFGEYVTVPATVGVAPIPEGVDFAEAAGLGLAGAAAVDSIDAATISQGDTVLIAGATGGVGQQALQLAVRAGATVIATAHSAEEVALVTRLGASATVDYTGDVSAQVLAAHPEGVDVVLHFAGDPSALVGAVKAGGILVSTMVQSPEQVPADGIRIAPIYAVPSRTTLDRLAANQADGHTAVTVEKAFPLDEAPQAFAHFGGGTLGKVIISIV